ncbi:hypothetical protein [Actinomadura sp. 3N407]|uniref:hypothetical protein n=1 Tax=Actinomadura sp. 3N407 TaxID=3457423 RepID=UPI003FCE30DF
MASKIVLHIGLQKSGTTFLQHMLQDNNEALAEADVLYPVPPDWERGKRTVANHEWSSYGLLGTEYPWVSELRASREEPSWQALLDQINAWPATVLLSAEALSVIRAGAVHRLLDALSVDDVEVVVTARSLGRSLPSLWQQHIRNGRSMSFEAYLGGLAAQRDKGWDHIETDPDAHIWRAFILSRLVRRWSEAGAGRVSVVTSPGRPPALLLERFTQAAGLPRLTHVPVADRQAHTGLTAPETLVLASLNAALRENFWPERKADRVRQVVTERFQARERRGGKVVIPLEWRSRLAEWSGEDLAALQDTGAHIVGDHGDLRYDPDLEKTSPPTPEETGRAGAEAALAFAEPALQESPIRRNARRLRRLMG